MIESKEIDKEIESELSQFLIQNFRPESYVQELFIKGGPIKAKKKASKLIEAKSTTSEELIKNVYTNYQKFIDTSIQISRILNKSKLFLFINHHLRIGNRYVATKKFGWRL